MSETRPQYLILSSNSLQGLQDAVNSAIKQGYRPFGNIVVEQRNIDTVYIQPVC